MFFAFYSFKRINKTSNISIKKQQKRTFCKMYFHSCAHAHQLNTVTNIETSLITVFFPWILNTCWHKKQDLFWIGTLQAVLYIEKCNDIENPRNNHSFSIIASVIFVTQVVYQYTNVLQKYVNQFVHNSFLYNIFLFYVHIILRGSKERY